MRALTRKALAVAELVFLAAAAPTSNGGKPLNVVQTTTTSSGQVIDWVEKASQGHVATPPPAPANNGAKSIAIRKFIMNLPTGPDGTVPVLRSSGQPMASKGRPRNQTLETRQSDAGQHWYASTAQVVQGTGGWGTFSLFDAFVEKPSDFSLLQTAVIYNNAAHAGGSADTVTQTVEAGWINYPNQVSQPHLFSYFTTNSYASEGDNIGGWNRDHAGFVQTDSSIYPGIVISPFSVDGGPQYDLQIGYSLQSGNWWLWVEDRYVGYYPASLFSQGVNASQTLASGSNEINFYGEIYNSEATITTTDMGSGEIPQTGFGHSAYIRNIQYLDTSSATIDYEPNEGNIISDSSRYSSISIWNSGSSWSSYMYLGGPGAGGVIGD